MSLDAKTKSLAESLMKKHHKNVIYVKKENGHMYFEKSAALLSVGGNEEKLEIVKAEKKDSKEVSLNPDKSWKLEDLKAYAEKHSIQLEPADKSKDAVLAKIEAAAKSAE